MSFVLLLLAVTSCFLHEEGLVESTSTDGDADSDGTVDGDIDDSETIPESCSDGDQNGQETDEDCGGPDCPGCGDLRRCLEGSDCLNGSCREGRCQPPNCSDGVRNGRENGIDCGGACAPCPHGLACSSSADCAPWGFCFDGGCDLVGNGRDGPLLLRGESRVMNQVRASASGFLGNSLLEVDSPVVAGFESGQRVLVHQTVGPHAGIWEEQLVKTVGSSTLSLQLPLRNSYSSTGGSKAQVVVVPQFTSVSLTEDAFLRAPEWDGSTGGILAFKSNGPVSICQGCAIDS